MNERPTSGSALPGSSHAFAASGPAGPAARRVLSLDAAILSARIGAQGTRFIAEVLGI